MHLALQLLLLFTRGVAMPMPLLYLMLALIVAAVAAWMINIRIPVGDNTKPILNVVLALLIVGPLLWLINTYVPMAGSIKVILNIVVIVATCVRVLQAFGLWNPVLRIWSNLRHRSSH
jgi:hypothetical protein